MARRNRPLVLLALALASGLLAAMLALRYLRQQSTPLVAAEPARSNLVVAAQALPVGALITEQDVKTIPWSGGALPAGFIGDPAQVIGRGLLASIEPNEPIMQGKLAAEGAGGGLGVLIDEGMRALSIPVDQIVGVAGFVLPSSRVDVLLTLQQGQNNNEPTTRIIMQNVKALAAGQTIQQDKEGKPLPVGVVTFLVSPEQAETLALASQQGRIQLALRNTMDTTAARTNGTRVSALLGTVRAPVGPRRAPARRAPDTTPERTTVEVYRGGVRSLERF
ncbi:MAG TPA: Flp pilus assembly protein CpaB [Gemmatimonadales bacterium]|nr:Flp pilus assembly protein CpaB [Gemmatimonadales bacterium]